MAESSSTLVNGDKPVIVRVKRKASHSALDAFWLEIHERPSKRPFFDFGKLSLSDSASSRAGELKTKKILGWHVETVISSEDIFSVLQSFAPNSSDSSRSKEKAGEGRHNIKIVHKQDLLLMKAKQKQEFLSRTARFKQIWRHRKGRKEVPEDDAVYETCQLYDVVLIDEEEHEVETQKEDSGLDKCRMMAQYLPLLEEVLLSAAQEVEEDIHDFMLKQASDGYVYDLYAFKEDVNPVQADCKIQIPLIRVDDCGYYDGPEYGSDYMKQTILRDNPLIDYPDEKEMFENETVDDVEVTSASLIDEKSKGESGEAQEHVSFECSDHEEQWFKTDEEQYW